MLKWFKSKNLNEFLSQTLKVKIKGIKFEIRKIQPLDYLEGQKVMQKVFETYQIQDPDKVTNPDEASFKKIKSHMADVILSGVVTPKLSREKEDKAVHIDDLFKDWDLCNLLYSAIMEFTYGKKNSFSKQGQAFGNRLCGKTI